MNQETDTVQSQHHSRTISFSSVDAESALVGFMPAFRNTSSGEVHLSRNADGELSLDHTFYHLPAEWVREIDTNGDSIALLPSIEAGFWRPSSFIPIASRIKLPLDS